MTASASAPSPTGAVTVYWRPGCPYCASLRRGLRRAGLATSEVNIWADRRSAATVRFLAGGNETVPTVVVGGTSFVNPSAAQVLAAAKEAGIPVVTPSVKGVRRSSADVVAVLQWVLVAALVVASFALDASGHAGASWILDAAALALYLGFRVVRRRVG